MGEAPTISTHVLDTEHGTPARGIDVALYRMGDSGEPRVGGGRTDDDGRIHRLLDTDLIPGTYRLDFHVDGRFFLEASVTFVVEDASRSYHVPLLLAPYSLSTYRGS
jgi:5-hydroxyisourate hydrolase